PRGKKPGKYSPFAGCSIFFIYIGIAAALIGFAIWVGLQMEATIKGFTEEKPATIEVVDAEGKESAQVALKNKLDGFRHDIEAGNKASITLTAEEMNLAIATFDILKPQRKSLHVTKIADGLITTEVAYPINAGIKSIFTKELRYMNGTLAIKPELVDGAAFPRIEKITPTVGKESDIPDELRQQLSETLLHPLHNDKELGPIFSKLSGVEIKGNTLLLQTDPAVETTESTAPKDATPFIERFMKGFAIVAVLFLALISVIIFLARRKAKQS
ncbi:MAG: hypothetical protein ACPG6P_12850, partial [Akkermansiaceae bacterium]